MLAIYTSANYQYIDRVLTLASSIKEHYPAVHFYFLLSERDVNAELEALVRDSGVHQTILIRDLSSEFTDQWIFGHNVIELCTAVKAAGANHLFEKGYEKVVYLDPDTVLFRKLDEVEEALDSFSCVLTPHICAPIRRDELKVIEHACFRHGVFNLGFGAWKNDENGREIIAWWHTNLFTHCYEEPWNSLYTDQKFYDLVPAIFDKVKILKSPAFNLATWNLEARKISNVENSESLLVNGERLAFFHFAGSGGRGRGNYDKWFSGAYPQLDKLWAWYENICMGWVESKPKWSYGYYDDGKSIDYEDRVAYRQMHKKVKDSVQNPFSGNWKQQLSLKMGKGNNSRNRKDNEVAALRAELALLRNSVPVRISVIANKYAPNYLLNLVRRIVNAR